MKKSKPRKGVLRFSHLKKIKRISSISVSPEGGHILFQADDHDPVENKVTKSIYRMRLRDRWMTLLTPGPGNHTNPIFSPDGKEVAFVSDREKEKGEQIWVMPTGGGEARRVTKGYGSVGSMVWAPDSKRIAFSRNVVVSPYLNENKKGGAILEKAPQRSKIYGLVNPKSSARIEDELLFRHWDHWTNRTRSHLFIVDATTSKMNDVTPFDMDVPPISLTSSRDFGFSPDGRELVFTMNPDKDVALSTNNSLFVIPIKGIKSVGEIKCVSNSDACDMGARYTRDGKYIVYLGMKIPGYESDKTRIKVYNRKTGKTKIYLDRFDRSPEEFCFFGDDPDNRICFKAQNKGRYCLYSLNLKNGKVAQLTRKTNNTGYWPVPGSDNFIVARQSLTSPSDLYLLQPGKGFKPDLNIGSVHKLPDQAISKAKKITDFGAVLNKVKMNKGEEFWFKAEDGVMIHGFLIKPPNFRKSSKYPMILLIHGGPQGAFMDDFHFRWNAQMFAARGAVVAFLNPRGSTGYGQKFTNEISGDWGGKCYSDIMRGVNYLVRKYKFIDKTRLGAAGASFGGYMVNWILGHSRRFNALVSHDGVFNAENMAYTTDELWFDEYEHGGMPHDNRDDFIKYSPHIHVKKFKTPTLVIQGANDFRCPVSEGIGLFTALQVMDVPSKFLYFPDEGHWVQKPANSEVWYKEVVDWLMSYLK